MHAYDKDGKKVTHRVLDDTEDVILDELRDIHQFGEYLYVVNANQTQNSLLCYQGSGTGYRFIGQFVSRENCKGVLHPFDFTFDGAGYCYVSSQQTEERGTPFEGLGGRQDGDARARRSSASRARDFSAGDFCSVERWN